MPAGSGLFSKSMALLARLAGPGQNGIPGEIAKLRSDVQAAAAPLAAIAVDEWVDPPGASTNSIVTSLATSIGASVVSGAGLDGVIGGAKFIAPRLISVTQASGNHYAGSVVINGFDVQGKPLSDTIALTADPVSLTTTAGVKYFSQILSIDIPAQQDALGSLTFGIYGNDLGLSRPVKARTGALFLIQEYMDGAVPSAGALVAVASALPYGAYAPVAAPDPAQPAVLTGTTDITAGSLYSTPAVLTGTTDVTAGGLYGSGGTLANGGTGLTLILNVNGAGPVTLTFSGAGTGNDASDTAMLAAILAEWPALASAVLGGAGSDKLVLTTTLQGTGASIVVGAGTANTALGLSGTVDGGAGTLNGETLILNVDGAGPLTITFAMATTSASEAAMLAAIEAEWPGLTAVAGGAGSDKLVLTTTATGVLASIVVGAGTADTALGISGSAVGNAGHDYAIMYEFDASQG